MNVRNQVENYLDYCRFRKELDQKTIKAYKIDLRQYFEYCTGEEPKKEEIEQYITALHRQYRQKTVKRKLASIKAFYNYLEEEELIAETPFRKIKVRFKEAVVLPRIIARSDIEILLNYMYASGREMTEKKRKNWLRDMALVETLFATGARVYEISNIRADCVDLKTGLMRIFGKGHKERYVQIGDREVLRLLNRYYDENRADIMESGYFFINNCGRRYTEQSVRLMIDRYTRGAGIARPITPHMFRHSFATFLIEEGVDISCVQQILGHSSIQTTQIYIHVAAERQAEILRKRHPRNHMHIDMGCLNETDFEKDIQTTD